MWFKKFSFCTRCEQNWHFGRYPSLNGAVNSNKTHVREVVPSACSAYYNFSFVYAKYMIVVLLPAAGIKPTSRYQRTILRRQPYTTRLPKYLSNSEWYEAVVVRLSSGTVTWVRFLPQVKGIRSIQVCQLMWCGWCPQMVVTHAPLETRVWIQGLLIWKRIWILSKMCYSGTVVP